MAGAPRSELRIRLISAAVGLPLLFALLWAGGPWFVGAAAAIAVFALWEALGLLRRARTRRGGGSVLLHGASLVAGAAYVVLPFAALISLRLGDTGLQWTALAFLATFATDTGAYAVGKVAGRRRMAPSISPGKTWEGAAGGLLGAVAATVALAALLDAVESRLLLAAGLGAVIGIVAQAGDLSESWLKRKAEVKDSGALIPGHGGLLDRLDSLLPVFVVVSAAAQVWRA